MLLDSPAEMRKQYYVGERKSRCSLSRTPLPKLKGDFLKQKSGSRRQKTRSSPVLETSVPRFGLGDRDSAPSFLLVSGGLAGPLTLPEFCDRAVFPVSEQRMSQAEHHSEALTLPLNPNRRLGKLGVVGRLSSGRPHFRRHGDCSSFPHPLVFPVSTPGPHLWRSVAREENVLWTVPCVATGSLRCCQARGPSGTATGEGGSGGSRVFHFPPSRSPLPFSMLSLGSSSAKRRC